MATSSIEKGLYAAPLGIEDLMDSPSMGPAIEIEIENPEGVRIGLDGMEIDLMPEENEQDFDANLAEDMDSSDLATVASDIVEMVDADINSRKEWVDMYVKGLDVLGMKSEQNLGSEPVEFSLRYLLKRRSSFRAKRLLKRFQRRARSKLKLLVQLISSKNKQPNV